MHKSLDLQNLTRGVLAVSRSHDFRKNGDAGRRQLQASIRQLLIKAGTKIPSSKYKDYVLWSQKLTMSLAPGVNPIAAPDYLSLSNLYEISGSDWQKTLTWVEARLSPYVDHLKSFFSKCATIEKMALRGDIEDAYALLISVEEDFGPSIHIIEIKLALAQLTKGMEEHKKIAIEMRGSGKGGLVGLLIYLVSIRNEEQLSFENYKQQVKLRSEKFKDKNFAKYINYRLLKEDPIDESVACSILQVEENHTIYDLAFTTNRLLKNFRFLAESQIAIKLLELTSFVEEKEFEKEINGTHHHLFLPDSGQSRSIPNAYRTLTKRIKKQPRLILKEVRGVGLCKAILSSAREAKSNSLYDVFTNCIALQMRGITAIGSDAEFLKTLLNFSCFPKTASLLEQVRIKSVNSNYKWPGANSFNTEDLEILEQFPKNDYIDSISKALSWLTDLQKNQRQEFIQDFVNYAKDDVTFGMPFPVMLSLEIAKAYCFFELKNPAEVSKITSTLVIDHGVRIDNLPVASFYERFTWKQISHQANLTQTAISLELYSRTIASAEINSYKKYAIEDLVNKAQKKVPSQLVRQDCNVSLKQFHFFLNIVCIQKNLDMLYSLKGSIHIDNERKAILSFLASSDKANASDYSAEVLSILHKSRLAQGIALIDRSRVHVDEDPLVNKLTVSLHDKWNRYKSLFSSDETSIADYTAILRTIDKSEDDSELFKVPKNESASLLFELIAISLDAFLHDIDHGLDRYLGHRVRHNAFANQVRGGLSESHILTKKVSGLYGTSEYWSERLANEDPYAQSLALMAMKDFSKDFDIAIEDTKERLLRVQRPGYMEGIFNVHITAKAFYLIDKIVSKDSNLPTFISGCFQIFWQLLVPSLMQTREYIGKVFSGRVSMLFGQLLKDISGLKLVNGSVLESTVVQARTDTSNKIEQAVKWFNKSAIDENSHVYSVSDALDIVIEACVSAHKAADPVVQMTAVGNIEIYPPALYQLSDIFWIIVDNACTHCGINRGVAINISVEAFSENKNLVVIASNVIGTSKAENSALENIAIIKSDIDKKQYTEKLLVEGKSGLKKLAALALRYTGGKIHFEVKNQEFSLHLVVPLAAIYIPEKDKK